MKNIVLIGMSGVGKTTIAKLIGRRLKGYNIIDTDYEIVKQENKSINRIFSEYGEDYFRNLEEEMIKEIYQRDKLIIPTGGGIILNPENVLRLRENGYTFYLTASVKTIYHNLRRSHNKRPLLQGSNNLYKEIENLYEGRKDLYIKSADFIVSVDNKSLKAVAKEIVDLYGETSSCGK